MLGRSARLTLDVGLPFAEKWSCPAGGRVIGGGLGRRERFELAEGTGFGTRRVAKMLILFEASSCS